MECCSTSGIGQKQVVNVCDGACLGYVTDIEINVCDGRVAALLVGGGTFLCKGEALRIPWCNVKCFGEDVILVEIVPAECKCTCPSEDKKKKRKIF